MIGGKNMNILFKIKKKLEKGSVQITITSQMKADWWNETVVGFCGQLEGVYWRKEMGFRGRKSVQYWCWTEWWIEENVFCDYGFCVD